MFDVDRIRTAFPGLDSEWAFFDNAGGTFPAAAVVERVREHLERWPVQLGASYPRSQEASARVAAGRAAAARLLHAAPEECILGTSTTINTQMLAHALGAAWGPGDAVVVTDVDHEAHIGPWLRLAAQGVEVRTWRADEDSLSLRSEDLEHLLADGKVRLVAFTHTSNVLGTIHDARAFCDVARKRGALTCIDGVAYAPHRRVDVQALGADFYLVSLYKIFGPHVGLLWGRADLLRAVPSPNHFFVPPEQLPQKLEPGNPCYETVAGIAGVEVHLRDVARISGAAEDDDPIDAAFEAIALHEEGLAEHLLAFLRGRPEVRILGEPSADRAKRVAVVSFVVEGRSSKAIVDALDAHRLAARFGHFYAQRLVARLGLLEQDGVVRVSLVHTNTLQELDRLVNALEQILGPAPARG